MTMHRLSQEDFHRNSEDDRRSRTASQSSQNTENSEFGPPTPRSAQSVEHASMHVAVPEIEPARSFHSRAVPNSFMQDEKLIKSSRVEYALRVSKEEIQILSSSGWAAKARRNGDKQESARKIDVRYSSNSGTLRAVLH